MWNTHNSSSSSGSDSEQQQEKNTSSLSDSSHPQGGAGQSSSSGSGGDDSSSPHYVCASQSSPSFSSKLAHGNTDRRKFHFVPLQHQMKSIEQKNPVNLQSLSTTVQAQQIVTGAQSSNHAENIGVEEMQTSDLQLQGSNVHNQLKGQQEKQCSIQVLQQLLQPKSTRGSDQQNQQHNGIKGSQQQQQLQNGIQGSQQQKQQNDLQVNRQQGNDSSVVQQQLLPQDGHRTNQQVAMRTPQGNLVFGYMSSTPQVVSAPPQQVQGVAQTQNRQVSSFGNTKQQTVYQNNPSQSQFGGPLQHCSNPQPATRQANNQGTSSAAKTHNVQQQSQVQRVQLQGQFIQQQQHQGQFIQQQQHQGQFIQQQQQQGQFIQQQHQGHFVQQQQPQGQIVPQQQAQGQFVPQQQAQGQFAQQQQAQGQFVQQQQPQGQFVQQQQPQVQFVQQQQPQGQFVQQQQPQGQFVQQQQPQGQFVPQQPVLLQQHQQQYFVTVPQNQLGPQPTVAQNGKQFGIVMPNHNVNHNNAGQAQVVQASNAMYVQSNAGVQQQFYLIPCSSGAPAVQLQQNQSETSANDGSVTMSEDDERSEQNRNKPPTSKYRGVYWNKSSKAWRARIWVNGRNEHIGNYDDEVEAALAWDRRSEELRGSRAPKNFPEPQKNPVQGQTTSSKRTSRQSCPRKSSFKKHRSESLSPPLPPVAS